MLSLREMGFSSLLKGVPMSKLRFVMVFLSLLGWQASASASLQGKVCSTGSGYFVSSFAFYDNIHVSCWGGGNSVKGAYVESDSGVAIKCGRQFTRIFQTLNYGSQLREVKTGTVWNCHY